MAHAFVLRCYVTLRLVVSTFTSVNLQTHFSSTYSVATHLNIAIYADFVKFDYVHTFFLNLLFFSYLFVFAETTAYLVHDKLRHLSAQHLIK